MLRLGVAAFVLGIVTLLFVAGGAAAEANALDTAPEIETTTAQEFGTAEVQVVDRSGNPVGGVEVTAVWDDGEGTDTTRSDGRALIDVPADTTVEFSVEHPDGEFVKNHQPVEASDVAGDTVTIEMAEPGNAAITVVDTNGNPVDGVQLSLYHDGDTRLVGTESTDSDGTAVFSDIEQRAYDIETLRAGYNTVESSFDLDSADVSEELEIESNRVDVQFTVVDDHFDPAEPVGDAIIDIEGFGTLPPTFSDDGTQDQSLPVNDEYEITVDKEGYDAVTETLTVDEEPTSLNVSIQRTPEITIEQLQSAVVTDEMTLATIRNAYGEPVEGASVSINDESVGQTDAQGQIFFNITATGENEISASFGGLTATSTIVGVEPSADTPADPDADGADDSDDAADDADDSDDSDADDADDDGAGLGVLVAVGALTLFVTVLARRR